MIWCIKTYIIAYVKTQKNKIHWLIIDFENRVRSVASTVLDGFLLYLAQMITIIRGCVACYDFFKIWKFNFLANFKKFSALTLKKIYSSRWILSIFSTNDH